MSSRSSSVYFSMYPNRTLCDVLREMRQCHETRNYSYLLGLIEEAQSMGNRMEAGLEDVKDVRSMLERKRELKKEIRVLEKKIAAKGGSGEQ
jgi:hypothetical protein